MLGSTGKEETKPGSKLYNAVSYTGFIAFFGLAAIYIWAHFPLPEISIIYELY